MCVCVCERENVCVRVGQKRVYEGGKTSFGASKIVCELCVCVSVRESFE